MSSKCVTKTLLFVFCLTIPTLIRSETRIVDFHARRQDNVAILEWATEKENGLEKFLVQRSTDQSTWTTVGDVKPEPGDSSTRRTYIYYDRSIFKNSISTFYYRLVIVNKNDQSTPYGVIVSITGSSGIKHTWGSIKAMFR